MPTWSDELRETIVANVEVTRQLVATAQAFFIEVMAEREQVCGLIDRLSQHYGAEWAEKIRLDPRGDNADVITQIARAVSVRAAGVEAIWRLIHSGYLLAGGTCQNLRVHVSWETESTGSGWSFEEFELPHPTAVVRAPSMRSEEILCNHDLYIKEMAALGLGDEVEGSLRDAVRCFASDLYTPCAAMLGSASESAWLRLGECVSDYISLSDVKKGTALRDKLSDPYSSVVKKMSLVAQQYGNRDLCGALWEAAEVKPRSLQTIRIWSDAVRDSRNAIHYGVDPTTPNTREKLSALLLGAIPFFRKMSAIASAASRAVESGTPDSPS